MQTRTVAIVGRPNVGKSALFNRLAGRKIAIVHDMPGVTRDRISAQCKLGEKPFTIFDTGGIGGNADATFSEQVALEADIAIETASIILLVVDAQSGITPVDQELARKLRRIDKPIFLVVNKVDVEKHSTLVSEFSQLGFKRQFAISAEHNHGIRDVVESIEKLLPEATDEETANHELPALQISIVGRPNVGKSSLINAILHDRRTMVSDVSGTTRDAVDIPYVRNEKRYVLIDTAGIRPRGKVDNTVEVFSVMRSEKSIERASICILVLDASAGVTSQDKKIAGMIQEARKPCIVVVNKWDLMRTDAEKQAFLDEIKAELFFLNYAPHVLTSAKHAEHISRVFRMIDKVREASAKRISTGVLNRLFTHVLSANPPPSKKGRRFKIIYATQPDSDPKIAVPNPRFVLFVNSADLLAAHYKKHLEAQIREQLPYDGLPIIFHFREREKRSETRPEKRTEVRASKRATKRSSKSKHRG